MCLWLAFLFRFVGALCIMCGVCVCVCVFVLVVRLCVCVCLCASIIGDSVRLCVCVVVAAIAWWWRPLYALLFVCVYACADAQSAQKIHSPAPQSYTHQRHARTSSETKHQHRTHIPEKKRKMRTPAAVCTHLVRTCVYVCGSTCYSHTRPGEW